jgi:hypothetical protein
VDRYEPFTGIGFHPLVAFLVRTDQYHVNAVQHCDIVGSELHAFVQPHPGP